MVHYFWYLYFAFIGTAFLIIAGLPRLIYNYATPRGRTTLSAKRAALASQAKVLGDEEKDEESKLTRVLKEIEASAKPEYSQQAQTQPL
jgi:hypothetical protein